MIFLHTGQHDSCSKRKNDERSEDPSDAENLMQVSGRRRSSHLSKKS